MSFSLYNLPAWRGERSPGVAGLIRTGSLRSEAPWFQLSSSTSGYCPGLTCLNREGYQLSWDFCMTGVLSTTPISFELTCLTQPQLAWFSTVAQVQWQPVSLENFARIIWVMDMKKLKDIMNVVYDCKGLLLKPLCLATKGVRTECIGYTVLHNKLPQIQRLKTTGKI